MLLNSIEKNGFTLLEMLIVISIMAIVAGISTMRYAGQRQEAEYHAARYEMQQIRQALLKYFQDQNKYTNSDTSTSPADMAFLVMKNNNDAWDINYRKGWRGPYLLKAQMVDVSVGDQLQFNGSGSNSGNLLNTTGIRDPFIQPGQSAGQPYLLFDMAQGATARRIVSMGSNGKYDGPDCDFNQTNSNAVDFCDQETLCRSADDDLVLCF